MKQVEIMMLSRSELFDKNNIPVRKLFNEYFGGGMSSIVFQELRESRALAYRAFARYTEPPRADRHHYILSFIGTQNDKLPEAMKAMTDLLNDMPESEKNFKTAQEAVQNVIRTDRITKSDILFSFLSAEKLGIDYDIRSEIFKKTPQISFDEIKVFHKRFIKDKFYTILVLGKKSELDIKTLGTYGRIEYLTLEDIFGY